MRHLFQLNTIQTKSAQKIMIELVKVNQFALTYKYMRVILTLTVVPT